ncbi:hypothetical protein Phum_PHUM225260 [Pediculus humanus corporis]|uniref:Uncharacterized protein n=1 Tax=Pediculus humanus subsp. corporis TaxID=121224 RepID=E0VIC9_PEDHC|nr:uncharacterized protein Phum_PHUM225260 [Pediculus humanus corporis]EEB13135.1 hypothetical protein Phum_PHUM225260 [Pediculus humanus corporis]
MKPGKKTGEEKKEKNLLKQHLNANQNRNLVISGEFCTGERHVILHVIKKKSVPGNKRQTRVTCEFWNAD